MKDLLVDNIQIKQIDRETDMYLNKKKKKKKEKTFSLKFSQRPIKKKKKDGQ